MTWRDWSGLGEDLWVILRRPASMVAKAAIWAAAFPIATRVPVPVNRLPVTAATNFVATHATAFGIDPTL
jgi:hypothetical protein